MVEHSQLAKLSENAYQSQGAPDGWVRIQSKTVDQTGFAAAAYRNGAKNGVTARKMGSESNY